MKYPFICGLNGELSSAHYLLYMKSSPSLPSLHTWYKHGHKGIRTVILVSSSASDLQNWVLICKIHLSLLPTHNPSQQCVWIWSWTKLALLPPHYLTSKNLSPLLSSFSVLSSWNKHSWEWSICLFYHHHIDNKDKHLQCSYHRIKNKDKYL